MKADDFLILNNMINLDLRSYKFDSTILIGLFLVNSFFLSLFLKKILLN